MQTIDIETGIPEEEAIPHVSKPPQHPAVAYLSRLRSKKPDGGGPGPFANRRKTLNFMTGGFLGGLGDKHRRSEVDLPMLVVLDGICGPSKGQGMHGPENWSINSNRERIGKVKQA